MACKEYYRTYPIDNSDNTIQPDNDDTLQSDNDNTIQSDNENNIQLDHDNSIQSGNQIHLLPMPDDPEDNTNDGTDAATHDDGDEQSAGNLHPVSLSSPG